MRTCIEHDVVFNNEEDYRAHYLFYHGTLIPTCNIERSKEIEKFRNDFEWLTKIQIPSLEGRIKSYRNNIKSYDRKIIFLLKYAKTDKDFSELQKYRNASSKNFDLLNSCTNQLNEARKKYNLEWLRAQAEGIKF